MRGSRLRGISTSGGDWLVDLALSAKYMEGKLGLTLGADNLFDQYPDRVPNNRVLPTPPWRHRESELDQRARVSRYSPYGFNGRFVYARLDYQLVNRCKERGPSGRQPYLTHYLSIRHSRRCGRKPLSGIVNCMR